MILPWIDIATHAYEAGFRGEAHAIVVALSQPESRRETRQHNPNDPNGGSFGLLQINGVHDPDAPPQPNPSGPMDKVIPTQAWIERMYDPAENLRAAFAVWTSAGRSFLPWGAYTSGLHSAWLPTAIVAMDARQRLASKDRQIQTLNAANEQLRAEKAACDARVSELEAQLAAERAKINAALPIADSVAAAAQALRQTLG